MPAENRTPKTSMERRLRRRQRLPELSYPPDLPILAEKDRIIEAIRRNPVVVVSGETGSGKTTQIPKLCLAAGRGIDGLIGCTQPRRIAASTVARRIAEELGEDLGQSVGYKIRFQDKTSKDAYIKVMTDGILLAEAQGDPLLKAYDTIIVDEAHERSLNIDFILGILKTLLRRRKDLRVVITSATIDTEKFSRAFDNAPVIEVSGRMFPVEVRYMAEEPDREGGDQTHVELAVRAVDRIQRESPRGDILVFMPTEQDIRDTLEILEGRNYPGACLLPLFARLSASEQTRIFSRSAGRKIIVATNIAETSITIPGIRYVVDTGLARISQYQPRSRTTSLPVLPVSRSSADQRKGRCGRVENGVCIRLYPEADYEARPRFTLPEILRSNLAEVILRMIALGLGDAEKFPFIDPPAAKSIRDGIDLLMELGAIEPASRASGTRYRLTETGRMMARIPLDPRLSRMLIQAQAEGCLSRMAVIAAALSIPDPRERPAENQEEADRAHALFRDPRSDFITYLNLWNRYREHPGSRNQRKKFCREHFISYRRMREWEDVHEQVLAVLDENAMGGDGKEAESLAPESSGRSEYDRIHRSILSGFLSNIALKKEKYLYRAAKDREVMIFPGSALFKASGPWIVAAEMVETSRLFARTAANIEAGWLEEIGRGRCRYAYRNPRWDKGRGEVVADEQVSLYGFVLVEKRPVSYGRIQPEEASEIFIRDALVEGGIGRDFSFLSHNQRLAEEIRDMENRLRRRDLLTGDTEIVDFYRQRLTGVCDIRTLQRHIRESGGDSHLRMKREDLLARSPDEEALSSYPDRILLGNHPFLCTYAFEPGRSDDGVTVRVPSSMVSAVRPEAVDWGIPGHFQEKVAALLRGLPKALRKRLVPVSDTAELIAREMPRTQEALPTALSRFIQARLGVDIPASAWPTESLPDHLRLRIAVTGARGEELRSGRDGSVLTGEIHAPVDPDAASEARRRWEKEGITCWDFGDLPESIDLDGKGGSRWTFYPGLEPAGGQVEAAAVNLRLFTGMREAEAHHRKGVEALYGIHFSKDLRYLKRTLTLSPSMQRLSVDFGGSAALERQLFQRVSDDLFSRNIRTRQGFDAHADAVAREILPAGRKRLEEILPVLRAYQEAGAFLHTLSMQTRASSPGREFLRDLREELFRLVPKDFILLSDSKRLAHLPRYIRALEIRAQRGLLDPEKERARKQELQDLLQGLDGMTQGVSPAPSAEKQKAVSEFFWMLEEYRVSLFAQELRTAVPVSRKRLEKKMAEIRRMV